MRKLFTWIGISSIGLLTIGLPLFFIGGTGQELAIKEITRKTATPENETDPDPLGEIIERININYELLSGNEPEEGEEKIEPKIRNSGFFTVTSLSSEVNTIIDDLGQDLNIIAKDYNDDLFHVQGQLNLIVRIDTVNGSVENVLEKNVEDNTSLAIAGIVFSVVGLIGIGAYFGLWLMNRNQK